MVEPADLAIGGVLLYIRVSFVEEYFRFEFVIVETQSSSLWNRDCIDSAKDSSSWIIVFL